jgi:glyoxylase-like metal-dependent hydrolase (beta-lactamase superfamily II)
MSRIVTDLAEGVHGVEDAYVNWYLLEEDSEVTIVDTGHPRSWRLLPAALRRIGRAPSDVKAVLLTHGHFDHMGFARRAHHELSAPVYVHAEDAGVAKHPWRYEHERARTPYLLRYPGFRRALAAMSAAGALWVRGTDEVTTFTATTALEVPGRPVPVPTPGHTYGHCAFHLPDRGTLLAGDAVVTFNPYTGSSGPQIVSAAATADSAASLDSLSAIAATGAQTVLTGHGKPWQQGAAEIVARARESGSS